MSWVVTKGRNIKVKDQLLFDVHRQYLLVTVFHLEPFENKLFELDFSIFKKTCFYG